MKLKLIMSLTSLVLVAGVYSLLISPVFRRPEVGRDTPCLAVGNVKLTGTLLVKSYFGPPNFGENPETDSKETVPVLVLDAPTKLCTDSESKQPENSDAATTASEFQLLFSFPHKPFVGRVVTVKGRIFRADTGHHHTDYLVDVESIRDAVPED